MMRFLRNVVGCFVIALLAPFLLFVWAIGLAWLNFERWLTDDY